MCFKKREQKQRWIIAGLGNYGPEYEGTRHNCGFDVVDILSEKHNIPVAKKKFRGLIGEGKIAGADVVLVKPLTFMNLSGDCVFRVLEWYKIPQERLIIVYDDVDLAPGTIRVRGKGSAGTHRGMKSVLVYTDTDEFPRVRVGIGARPEYMEMADYVLGHFTEEELAAVRPAERNAAEAVETIISKGTDAAMSIYNTKKR